MLAGRATRLTSAVTVGASALVALSACLPADDARSEVYEIAGILPSNVLPQSSPASLLRTFRKVCVDSDGVAQMEAALRSSDYVEVPARRRTRSPETRFFVVDTTAPLVGITIDEKSTLCTVSAGSRTGQTNRFEDFVAEIWPEATPLAATAISPSAETAWALDSESKNIAFSLRDGPPSKPATYTIAILRQN